MASTYSQEDLSAAYERACRQGGKAPAPAEEETPLNRKELQLEGGMRAVLRSMSVLGALGLGLYHAWVYLSCFSPKLYWNAATAQDMAAVGELASFIGYLAVIALCVCGTRRACETRRAHETRPQRVIAYAVLTAVGTAFVAVSSFLLEGALAYLLVSVFSLAAGVGSGFVLVYWARLFASGKAHVAFQVAGGLLVSFVATAVIIWLPFQVATGFIALLPLASGVVIARGLACANISEPSGEAFEEGDVSFCRIKWRLGLGLVAMGLVYGLAYGFAFDYARMGIEVSTDCILVNGLLGAVVLTYAVKRRKNFGYSAFGLAVLPLAGFAQCMIAVLQTDLLPLSFFFMRLAYVLFDILLWLRLPKVFARIGTIRTFLISRLLLEGSAAVGIVTREFLTLTGFQVFDAVALAALAFLLFALTLAGKSEDSQEGNMWDLMPAPTPKTGRFRDACMRIASDHGLTRREVEIMELVLRARSGTFVQDKLVISKSTFQTHMRNLYHKLGVHSNQELVDLLEQYLSEDKESRPSR